MTYLNKILILFLLIINGCVPIPRLVTESIDKKNINSNNKNLNLKEDIRIAFGSCANEDAPQPIWDSIIKTDPDCFLFLGDNVYADIPKIPTSGQEILNAYKKLGSNPGWMKLKNQCPIFATWDDHDYGKNDAGNEWVLKKESQKVFCDFYELEKSDPRRLRDGVYYSTTIEKNESKIQIILLDTRFFRTKLNEKGNAPYKPINHPDANMLGDVQWKWLEEQLKKSADLRIICSSIQVVSEEHQWEGWKNMPKQRQKLFDLLEQTNADHTIFLSGDRHLAEISCDRVNGPFPIWDFTSSGFNWGTEYVEEKNKWRTSPLVREPNFGTITANLESNPATVTLTAHAEDGSILFNQIVKLQNLTSTNQLNKIAP